MFKVVLFLYFFKPSETVNISKILFISISDFRQNRWITPRGNLVMSPNSRVQEWISRKKNIAFLQKCRERFVKRGAEWGNFHSQDFGNPKSIFSIHAFFSKIQIRSLIYYYSFTAFILTADQMAIFISYNSL